MAFDFIIGGCYQGKTAYVERTYQYGADDRMDGAKLSGTDMAGCRCLNHLHLLIRRLLEEQADVHLFLEQLFEKNEIKVVITDEIGCGIVPADAFERRYRETAGRECCILAQRADRVIRIMNGLECRIK